MVTIVDEINRVECIELRQQANYWRAQHARACQRQEVWKAKALQLESTVRKCQATIDEQSQQLETLKARVVWLTQQVFGRKTESTIDSGNESQNLSGPFADPSIDSFDSSDVSSQDKRKRGQQKGAKGHGRKLRLNLPSIEMLHELGRDKCCCPKCGKPFSVFPSTEDSEQIEWDVILRRRIDKHVRYIPTCNCHAIPGIVTAPPPAKLIPRSMFATSFWIRLIMEKFLFQRPLYRVRKVLALEGLSVSQGTLTGGLRRLGELLQPVYAIILEHNRQAKHWKMDETRWMVFEEIEGKNNYRWWLWVVITDDTVVYLLEPTRSAQVPKNHLPQDAEGIINADRYIVYKILGEKIQIAFCWSHVRRDFVQVRDGYRHLHDWGQAWIDRINEIFRLNDERLEVLSDSQAFQIKDRILRDALDAMTDEREHQLTDPSLHKAARKKLESLRNHWKGCTLFVDHPEIPMDNNESERKLRDPAVGRKNYYGSGSVWSGALTAILFTIFQTLLKNKIDPQKWLFAYFQAYAQNRGRPPDNLNEFLPWNLSEKDKKLWYYSERSPFLAALGFGAAAWTVAPRDRFIGWTAQQRKHNLHLVVNNARFLILPWVTSHNLASRILAGIAKQLPHDWQERYSYKPVLLETFVEQKRFRGSCYRAANWTHVGQTKGRGKLDRQNLYLVPVKDIFLYPLDKHFRQTLHCQA